LNSGAGAAKGELVAGSAAGVCPSNWALLKPESAGAFAAIELVEAKGSNGFAAADSGPVGCMAGWLAKGEDAGGEPKVWNSGEAGGEAGAGANKEGAGCCGATGSGAG
jgi:hypothetical protein